MATLKNSGGSSIRGGGPDRLAPKRMPRLIPTIVATLAGISAMMLWLTVPNLISGSGFILYAKVTLLAGGGGLVAYGVNRLAVERGAFLASRGFWTAGIMSLLVILIVGGGSALTTYAGFTVKNASQLRLDEHGDTLTAAVDRSNRASLQASRIVAPMTAIGRDLAIKAECEPKNHCVSRMDGPSASGQVARVLVTKAGTNDAILRAVTDAEAARAAILKRLNELVIRYQVIAQSTDRTVDEKWPLLQAIDAQIRQALADLEEAMPVNLVAGYAKSLADVDIAGRPEITRRVIALLRGYEATLREALDSVEPGRPQPSVFPRKVPASVTLAYVTHFSPVATVCVIVDVIFPVVLWVFVFLNYLWGIYRNDPDDDDDIYSKLLQA